MKKIIIFTLLILFSTTIFAKKTKKQENFWKVFVEHPNKKNYEKCKKGFKTICTEEQIGYGEKDIPTKEKFLNLLKNGNEWAMRLGFAFLKSINFYIFFDDKFADAFHLSLFSNPKLYFELAEKSFYSYGLLENKDSGKYDLKRLEKTVKFLKQLKLKKYQKLKEKFIKEVSEKAWYVKWRPQYNKNIKILRNKKTIFFNEDNPKGLIHYFYNLGQDYFKPYGCLFCGYISHFFTVYSKTFSSYSYKDFIMFHFFKYINNCKLEASKQSYIVELKLTVVNDVDYYLHKEMFPFQFTPFFTDDFKENFSFFKNHLAEYLKDSHIKNISNESLDMVSKVHLKYDVCNLVKEGYCKNQTKKMNETFEKWKKQKKTKGQQKIFKEISKEFEYYKKKLKNDHKCYEKDYCFYSQDFIFSNK